jgi:hypothetical protein
MIIGKIRDASTSYSMGFVVLICLALPGALAVALLPQKKLDSVSEFTPPHKEKTIKSGA